MAKINKSFTTDKIFTKKEKIYRSIATSMNLTVLNIEPHVYWNQCFTKKVDEENITYGNGKQYRRCSRQSFT